LKKEAHLVIGEVETKQSIGSFHEKKSSNEWHATEFNILSTVMHPPMIFCVRGGFKSAVG
jgi:hypothetical protein